jgi:hypothetical protein
VIPAPIQSGLDLGNRRPVIVLGDGRLDLGQKRRRTVDQEVRNVASTVERFVGLKISRWPEFFPDGY